MTVLIITVAGTPAPQGSKRHVGHGRMIEMSRRVKPWRDAVAAAAAATASVTDGWGPGPCAEPVHATITFTVDRPASHYSRSGQLRPDAPAYPTSRRVGDLDKLIRSTSDALVDSAVIRDDSQIVTLRASKLYMPRQPAGACIILVPESTVAAANQRATGEAVTP